MKIGGPKGPGPVQPPRTDVSDKAQGVDPAKVDQGKFDQLLAEGAPSTENKAGAATPAGQSAAIQSVTAQLRAGEITGQQAVEALVGEVVHKRGAILPPELRERLEELLKRVAAEDPLMAGQLKRMQGDDPGLPES